MSIELFIFFNIHAPFVEFVLLYVDFRVYIREIINISTDYSYKIGLILRFLCTCLLADFLKY